MAERGDNAVAKHQREVKPAGGDPATAAGAGNSAGTGEHVRDTNAGSKRDAAEQEKSTQEKATLTLELAEVEHKPRRTRTSRASKQATLAKETARTICDVVDAVASSANSEAAMNPVERALIEDPLARILARSDASALSKYASIIDPVLLLAGIALYVNRVRQVAGHTQEKKAVSEGLRQNLQPVDGQRPDIAPRLQQKLVPAAGPVS